MRGSHFCSRGPRGSGLYVKRGSSEEDGPAMLMMHKFILPFFLLAVPAVALSSKDDSTITKVVKLLQEMLDKSKEDGTNDRTVYARFKCYCDTTTAKKTKAIEETTAAIEGAEAQLEDLRAQNTKLSQEVIHRSYLFLFPDFRQGLLHSWIPSVRFVH